MSLIPRRAELSYNFEEIDGSIIIKNRKQSLFSFALVQSVYPDENEEEGEQALKHSMSCNLMLDETKIPLEASIATDGNATFSIGLESISFGGLSEMAELVGGFENFSFPSQIDDLGAISLDEFKIEMDLSKKLGNYISE